MADPKFDRVQARVPIADKEGKAAPSFVQFWDRFCRGLEALFVRQRITDERQDATDIAIQDLLDTILGILNGTIPFSELNVASTQYREFLEKTDGSKLTDPTGLANGVVGTSQVALSAITNGGSSPVSGVVSLAGITETSVASQTYVSSGGELEISANFYLTVWHPAAGGIDCRIRIYRDFPSTPLFDKTFTAINGDLIQGWQTPKVIETRPAGSYAYLVTAQASNAGFVTAEVDAATVLIREFRR